MIDTARLTSSCWSNRLFCELCGGRDAEVVLRVTSHGHACLTLCPRCRGISEPLATHTAAAAVDHRGHVVRAVDSGELT